MESHNTLEPVELLEEDNPWMGRDRVAAAAIPMKDSRSRPRTIEREFELLADIRIWDVSGRPAAPDAKVRRVSSRWQERASNGHSP